MKIKIISNYFIGLVAIILLFVFFFVIHWHTGKQDTLAAIKARGVLRVSTLDSTLTWHQTQLQSTGIDYELAKRYADYLGVKLEVRLRPSIKALFDDLDNHRTDLLAAGLNWDKKRAATYGTSPAYYTSDQQLVYRVGQPRPADLSALKGKLAVPASSSYVSLLEEAKAQQYPELQWEERPALSPVQVLAQVATGQLDYTLADSATIDMMQRIYPQLAIATDIANAVPVNWYFRHSHDHSLDNSIADFYQQMEKQHVLSRLEAKYLGHHAQSDVVDTRAFLRAMDTLLPRLQPLFEKYAQPLDWHLLAAVAWQESHWDHLATSPTGVRGMMMLTLNTASSVNVDNRLDMEQSIRGGSQYLQTIIERLPSSIEQDERIWFALAAYNIGLAHLMDARTLTSSQGGDPNSWSDVKSRLPLLSQRHYYSQTTYGYARGQQAYLYVENIRHYLLCLLAHSQMQQQKEDNLETQLVMN